MAAYFTSLFVPPGSTLVHEQSGPYALSPLSSPFASPMIPRKTSNQNNLAAKTFITKDRLEVQNAHTIQIKSGSIAAFKNVHGKGSSPLRIDLPNSDVITWGGSAPASPTVSGGLLSPGAGSFDASFDFRSRDLLVRRQDSAASTDSQTNTNTRRQVVIDLSCNIEFMTYTRAEYDRTGGRAAKLTQREKAEIRAELISFKLNEMDVHPESKQYLNLYNRQRRQINLETLEAARQREEEENRALYSEIFDSGLDQETIMQFSDMTLSITGISDDEGSRFGQMQRIPSGESITV